MIATTLLAAAAVVLAYELLGLLAGLAVAVLTLAAGVFALGASIMPAAAVALALLLGALALGGAGEDEAEETTAPAATSDEDDRAAARERVIELSREVERLRSSLRSARQGAAGARRREQRDDPARSQGSEKGKAAN